MNYSTAIFLVNPKVRCIAASYELNAKGEPAQVNPFKTLDPTIMVGDFVVVPTETRHMMTVCRVEDVDLDVDFDNPAQMRWVVGKVDTVAHAEILAREDSAIQMMKSAEKRSKQEELRRKLIADNPQLAALQNIGLQDDRAALAPPPPSDEIL